MTAELTGKQRRYLRSLGHHMNAIVQIGHEGITEGVVRQAQEQLEAHELIKIRLGETSPDGRHEAAEKLSEATGAQVAQILGRTILLYRARKEKPEIKLP